MIKSSNKVVLKNEEGKTLEIPAKNFKAEKYINSTIEGYKYILEIDGNEINFSDSKKRTEFLKTINNCFVGDVVDSFNTYSIPTITLELNTETLANFHEGLVAIKKNNKFGFVNRNGNLIIPFIYDIAIDFHEGLARVEKNGKWGFIDKTGKVIVPFEYDEAYDFQDGLARASKNNKWGYVNALGEVVVPCEYDIDETGEEVIQCQYNELLSFCDGLTKVEKNGKWGFINESGEVVIPFEYDYISNFQEGFSQVLKDGKIYYIDKNNQKLNLKIIINEASDIFNIPNNSTIIDAKIGYALDFQDGNRVLFNSNEEREEFIKLIDKTININPSYKSKKLTKK